MLAVVVFTGTFKVETVVFSAVFGVKLKESPELEVLAAVCVCNPKAVEVGNY